MITETMYCDACGHHITNWYDTVPRLLRQTYAAARELEEDIHICADCHDLDRDPSTVEATYYTETATGTVLLVETAQGGNRQYYAPENAPEPHPHLIALYEAAPPRNELTLVGGESAQ